MPSLADLFSTFSLIIYHVQSVNGFLWVSDILERTLLRGNRAIREKNLVKYAIFAVARAVAHSAVTV